ncbi:MAG: hypothetical protein ACFCU4_02860 [Puniceicoccaceae bacterium]
MKLHKQFGNKKYGKSSIYAVLFAFFVFGTFCILLILKDPGIFFTREDTNFFVPHDPNTVYRISSTVNSFWALDGSGNLLNKDGLPKHEQRDYELTASIIPSRTAFIIMDPWIDAPSEFLNHYYNKIIEAKILPLTEKAISLGHPVFILTNNPQEFDYSATIHAEFENLAENGNIKVLYHQDYDADSFSAFLKGHKIHSLIYTGFASNMCVIGREMGMIPMKNLNFRLFFIPEASAAVELADTWESQEIHKSTTSIISQWIAQIIHYDDFMAIKKPAAQDNQKLAENGTYK